MQDACLTDAVMLTRTNIVRAKTFHFTFLDRDLLDFCERTPTTCPHLGSWETGKATSTGAVSGPTSSLQKWDGRVRPPYSHFSGSEHTARLNSLLNVFYTPDIIVGVLRLQHEQNPSNSWPHSAHNQKRGAENWMDKYKVIIHSLGYQIEGQRVCDQHPDLV